MSRTSTASAYVLHQWDWSETSLVLDLYTREQGRVAAVAKGAKRPTSQLRAVLLPFQRVLVSLARPRGDEGAEVVTLRGAEYAGGAAILPAARLMAGFYLNELLLALLARHDPHERLFDAYADTLVALAGAATSGGEEAALRAFEIALLKLTGVLPDLGRGGVSLAPLAAERVYELRPDLGLVQGGGAGLTGAQWLALQAALDGGAMAALRAACAAALPALRAPLREALHYHLGSATLRSRETQHALRALADSASPAS